MTRLQFVSKITKMFSNGGDEVFNGMLDSGLQDIIQEIIKALVWECPGLGKMGALPLSSWLKKETAA